MITVAKAKTMPTASPTASAARKPSQGVVVATTTAIPVTAPSAISPSTPRFDDAHAFGQHLAQRGQRKNTARKKGRLDKTCDDVHA